MTRSYLELHVAVFLFGFTAILGALIDMSAMALVCWRVVLSGLFFVLMVNWPRLRSIRRSEWIQLLVIGMIVAVHWLCFYGAIKLSNASITLVCMATASFFTALVEPLFTGTRWKWQELMLGLLIVPAMVLIVNGVDTSMYLGVGVGLAAAFLAAVFASWNKCLVDNIHPLDMSAIEIWSAAVVMIVVTPLVDLFITPLEWQIEGAWQWLYMLVLVLLCTNLAYLLAVRALKELSAFAANLVINLEPVYGILLAWIILKENKEMSETFYFGAAIIVLVIIIHGLWSKRMDSKIEG